MTRPARRRASTCLLAVLLALVGLLSPLGAAPGSADEADTPSPLRVSIDTLSPGSIPEKGRITVTGEVTNRSKDTWHDLKAYLFTSQTPITSRSELAQAAATDEATDVGHRIARDGLFQDVGDLAPGDSVPYTLSLRRQDLDISGAPGVYWLGVHVLGADSAGNRDSTADGRARTFVPLVPPSAVKAGARTRLALLMPIKQEVRRGPAGRLMSLPAWQQQVALDGRLYRLLQLSSRATAPITWIVDPAVLDAVQSVAQDNPKLDTGPSTAPSSNGDTASDSASTSPSGSASPSGSGQGSDQGDVGSAAEPSEEAKVARAWLDEFRRQAPGHTITTVPYGDLDVASALGARQTTLYDAATGLSAEAMKTYGVDGAPPVIDPSTGVLPGSALRRVAPDTTVVLDDTAYPDDQGPVLRQTGRAPVVLSDTAAGSGGPRPNSRYAALAVRQRLLSDAALQALSPTDRGQALVASTPPYWDPGKSWSESGFFAGLDQPWLDLVDLPSVVAETPAPVTDPHAPEYPRSDRAAQVPATNLLASRQLLEKGRTFAALLTDNDTVDGTLSRMAMLGSSTAARTNPGRAMGQVTGATGYVDAQMSQVKIEGPGFVMMSGESGDISVKLVNDLDRTVTVGVAATSRTPGLRITTPDPVTLAPGQRSAIRLTAQSDDIGVHSVSVYATTADGRAVGGLTQFSVRTSHVGTVIWVIIAAGGVLLFLAIAVRLFRRIRRRRRTHGPLLARPDGQPPVDATSDEPTDRPTDQPTASSGDAR